MLYVFHACAYSFEEFISNYERYKNILLHTIEREKNKTEIREHKQQK